MESDLVTCDTSKLFYRYLVPSIGGTLVTSIYSFIDTIAVGQACGPEGSAAIAVINPIYAAACFLGMLTGTGGAVEISQARGTGNQERARDCFTVSLIEIAFLSMLLWLLVFLFLEPILLFSGADQMLLPYASAYCMATMPVLPLFALNIYLGAVVRSDEDPDLVLKGVLLGGAFNIFGDWFFVFPLGMGMAGAGTATALGNVINTLVLLSHFRKRGNASSLVLIKPSGLLGTARRVNASGLAASLLDISLVGITILMNQQAMKYGGRTELAVLGVIVTISFLLQHLFAGAGQAAIPIASANYGAGKDGRVRESFRLLVLWAFILGAFFMLSCALQPERVLRLFMATTESVLETGPRLVTLYSLSFLLLSVNLNLVLFLEAVQRPATALALSLSRALLCPALFLLVLPPALGVPGICWGMVLAELLTALYALPQALSLLKSGK